jgi:hypothetical protein
VLIHRDDLTFQQAQNRLLKTTNAPEVKAAPEPERTLFLQAESLYRYRFTPTPRSVSSQLAQTAAVVAELPALQAYAGSLDLMELRTRASDGAVQLWETLLAQYPCTTLRPLTLYRLGWAYRSTGVSGLPRDSGDEAFADLLRSHSTSPLAPLAREAMRVPWKSRDTATTWSLVPGLGQMYVGDYGSGLAYLGVALAAVAMIVVPAAIAFHRRSDLEWRGDWPLLAIAGGGVIVLTIDYTLAYQDVLRSVVLYNEKAEPRFESQHPNAP